MKKLNSIKLIFCTLAVIFSANLSEAQCPVTAYASSLTIECGDAVTLGAVATGCQPLNNNFNGGTIGSDWAATNGAVVTNGTGTYACAGPPPEGTNYLWMGATVAAPRGVTTNDYDLTQCGAISGTICFTMKYATQGGASPCEGIDLPAEGISVQYSTNGGGTWTTIQYYDPNGGYDPVMTQWNRYCLNIPAAALTTSTRFRWYQSQSSGVGFDTWGLDDMVITLNGPGYTFDWAHDAQGPSPSSDTPPVTPTSTTTYTVTYTNGVALCTSDVTVTVNLPTVSATASPVTICEGNSSQLEAISSLIANPPTSCGINTYAGCPANSDAGEPQIGAGTTVSSYNSGSNYVFGDFGSSGGVRTQIIYRASELIAAGFSAGQITNMQFDVAAIQDPGGNPTYNNFTIQMGCTSSTAFASSSDWRSGLTTVFPPTNVALTIGWNTFFFPNSYNWDGVSNIIVQLCWYNGTNGANSSKCRTAASGFNSMIASYVNASGASLNCASHTSFQSLYTFRPNTRFGTCVPKNQVLDYTWTPSATLSNPTIYNPVATPTSSTTYTVSVQAQGAPAGCATSANVTVNISPAPVINITASPCVNGITNLVANGQSFCNTTSTPEHNSATPVVVCVDVSGISPSNFSTAFANLFVNITHCDATEVTIAVQGPGTGGWTTLTGFTSGGRTWTTLPAGPGTPAAGANVNGTWCIRYSDNCVGCGPFGINDCGGAFFNGMCLNFNQGSNSGVTYVWTGPNLNSTSGQSVYTTATSGSFTVTATNAAGCSSVGTFAVTSCGTALPIELVSFDATLRDDDVVDVYWQTVSERNNDYFTVERSSDGEHWQQVLIEKGAGNSDEVLNYLEYDYSPLAGVSYYRLKQTNFDGAFTYSNMVSISNFNDDVVNVNPNPNNGNFKIQGNLKNADLSILNMLGKVVYQYHITDLSKDGGHNIDLTHLSNGMYMLQINTEDKTISEKINVIK